MVLAAEDDWLEVVSNLSQAMAVWKRMTIILIREGVETLVSGYFFKSMVQAVLLFGSETYVVTSRMGKALGGFQDQVARRLTGRFLRQKLDREWKYTLEAAEREEAGFQTMEEYIRRQKNIFAQYIATQSLLDLCYWSYRAIGGRVGMRWWEQAGINLAGSSEAAAVAAEKYWGEE